MRPIEKEDGLKHWKDRIAVMFPIREEMRRKASDGIRST